jgi:tRNA pseudouridine55 synthase
MIYSWSGVIAVDKPRGVVSSDIVHLVKHALTHARFSVDPKANTLTKNKRRAYHGQPPSVSDLRYLPIFRTASGDELQKPNINWPYKDIKVGHGGTLDPLASGVLVLGINGGTKHLNVFLTSDFGCRKRYICEARLGLTTASYDCTSEAIGDVNAKAFALTRDQVESAMKELFGGEFNDNDKTNGRQIQQRPPIFSALRVGGKRMYDIARDDATPKPEIETRPVTLFDVKLLDFVEGKADVKIQTPVLNESIVSQLPLVRFEVECGGGTYIRSMVYDLGEALGCGAFMDGLRRTRQGPFSVDVDIDDTVEESLTVEDALDVEQLHQRMISLDKRGIIAEYIKAKQESHSLKRARDAEE